MTASPVFVAGRMRATSRQTIRKPGASATVAFAGVRLAPAPPELLERGHDCAHASEESRKMARGIRNRMGNGLLYPYVAAAAGDEPCDMGQRPSARRQAAGSARSAIVRPAQRWTAAPSISRFLASCGSRSMARSSGSIAPLLGCAR